MTVVDEPTGLRTSAHIGGIGHSVRRKEDDRFCLLYTSPSPRDS